MKENESARIELMAITKVTEMFVQCGCWPNISQNDKTPSYDGCVYCN